MACINFKLLIQETHGEQDFRKADAVAARPVDLEGGLTGGVLDDPVLVPAGPLLLDRPPQLIVGRVDLLA